MTRTSSISGTFSNRQRSPVRTAAASSFSAAFLAPETCTVPCSGRPPSIRNASGAAPPGGTPSGSGLASAMQWNTAGVSRAGAVPPGAGPRRPGSGAARAGAPRARPTGRPPRRSPPSSAFSASSRAALAFSRSISDVEVRGLRHHDDLVRPHLQEPARDREQLLLAALPDGQLPDPEQAHQRRVVRQDPELAVDPGHEDHVDIVLVREPLGRDDFKVERHRQLRAGFDGRSRRCRCRPASSPAGLRSPASRQGYAACVEPSLSPTPNPATRVAGVRTGARPRHRWRWRRRGEGPPPRSRARLTGALSPAGLEASRQRCGESRGEIHHLRSASPRSRGRRRGCRRGRRPARAGCRPCLPGSP